MEFLCVDAVKEIFCVEEVSEQECKNFLEVLKDLSDREERILRLYYGIDDGIKKSLEDLAKEFGVTREVIRQTLAKAIKKLRHPTRSKRIFVK